MPHHPPRDGVSALVPDQFRHEGPDDGAAPGQDRLDGHRPVVDPAHHLDLLADDIGAVLAPVGLRRDEEGGLSRVAIRRLNDEFITEACLFGDGPKSGPAVDPGEHVRHAGCASLVAQLGGDDLGVQMLTQTRCRQDQVVAQFLTEVLGFAVEEHHRDLGPDTAWGCRLDVGAHLRVGQQPVVDLLATLELLVRLAARGEHSRMRAVPGVVVRDVREVAHPAVEPQQVERGRTEEQDRHIVGAEEVPHLGDVLQPTSRLPGTGGEGRVRADADLTGFGRLGTARGGPFRGCRSTGGRLLRGGCLGRLRRPSCSNRAITHRVHLAGHRIARHYSATWRNGSGWPNSAPAPMMASGTLTSWSRGCATGCADCLCPRRAW